MATTNYSVPASQASGGGIAVPLPLAVVQEYALNWNTTIYVTDNGNGTLTVQFTNPGGTVTALGPNGC